jgi:hypothetical protein
MGGVGVRESRVALCGDGVCVGARSNLALFLVCNCSCESQASCCTHNHALVAQPELLKGHECVCAT